MSAVHSFDKADNVCVL